jgi:hypothetical protein
VLSKHCVDAPASAQALGGVGMLSGGLRLTAPVFARTGRFETRSFPSLARRCPRDFTFYVADPSASLKLAHFPLSLVATLATLPSMSLTPQLHSETHSNRVDQIVAYQSGSNC